MLNRELNIAQRVWTSEESFRHCEQITARHYENFPVASLFIPSARRKYVCAIYAFARIADDFADEPGLTSAERIENLNRWEELLTESYSGSAHDPVFVAVKETADRFQIPIGLFQSLLRAFRSDVTIQRHETFEDLLAYCNQSANPVGRLVLLLFNYRGDVMMKLSDSICSALQLTNFWQDISIDLEKDRVYIPMEDLRRFGYKEEDLRSRVCSREFRQLLRYEVDRTEQFFFEGAPLLREVGKDLSRELALTWNGGMRILRKIRLQEFDVFEKRPVLSAGDKVSVLFRSLFTG